MTATLFAELQERATVDLVADIVQGVLDEAGQAICHQRDEPTMVQARLRLERLIRAGSSR